VVEAVFQVGRFRSHHPALRYRIGDTPRCHPQSSPSSRSLRTERMFSSARAGWTIAMLLHLASGVEFAIAKRTPRLQHAMRPTCRSTVVVTRDRTGDPASLRRAKAAVTSSLTLCHSVNRHMRRHRPRSIAADREPRHYDGRTARHVRGRRARAHFRAFSSEHSRAEGAFHYFLTDSAQLVPVGATAMSGVGLTQRGVGAAGHAGTMARESTPATHRAAVGTLTA
jgi:hypothetical protein